MTATNRIMFSTSRRSMYSFLFNICLLIGVTYANLHAEEMARAREMAKPWLMRDLTIGGTTLPISPATILTFIFVVVNLIYAFTSTRWAEASHILIKDPSSKTKAMMTEMRKEIGKDLKSFGLFAKKYSECPSKTSKGDLGRFKPGDMTPPFDKAVFDPKSPVGAAIGPIRTQHGYHLIYIRDRRLS